MIKTELTHKQELFCQHVVNGETLKDAYLGAYDTKTMGLPSVYVEAHRLAESPKIALRIDGLKAELAQSKNWTREKAVECLIETIETAKSKSNPMAIIAAIKLLNDMHGYDKPEKREHEFQSSPVFIITPVSPNCEMVEI